jgi:phospholipid/cholesterol/gamma-HCH transport system substrate-binding protein
MSRRMLPLLLTLALLAGGCGVLGANGSYTVTAELSRSYNLFPGSPVRVAGIDIGTIADVAVPEGADTVEVALRIDGDVDLPADASAVVIPESLIGERYVQLPAHRDGPTLADGDVIPLERTQVPYEFDEVLESLNSFVGAIDEDEMGRFVGNLAGVLDGQGDQLGRTLDHAREAGGVLKDNDEELIALAGRLADLNATLATRDEQLGRIIEDFDTLAGSLVDDGEDIDAALTGLVRMTQQLGGLLETNRATLEEDIGTLTRVGRTAQRNLDYLSVGILHSAELFRHAERVIDRDRNMLPLQNQTDELPGHIADAVISRIEGICLQAGLDEAMCATELIEELLGGDICLPPLLPCGDGDDGQQTLPIEDALANLAQAEPELGEVVVEEMTRRQQERDAEDDAEAAEELDEPDDQDASDGAGGLLDGLLQGGER